jgi:hypothetical protein
MQAMLTVIPRSCPALPAVLALLSFLQAAPALAEDPPIEKTGPVFHLEHDAPTVRLEYVRAPGAEACGDEQAVRE